MRKRKFLFGVLLAILTAFTFGFKINTSSKTYAAGVVTITFDANVSGSTEFLDNRINAAFWFAEHGGKHRLLHFQIMRLRPVG